MKWPMVTRFCYIFMLVLLALGVPVAAQDSGPDAPLPTPAAPVTAVPIPRPLPVQTLTQGHATLELFFSELPQGSTGVLRVTGEGLAGARARFLNELIEFFAVEGDGFYAFIAPSMEQSARQYSLDVFTWYADNTRETINTQVNVTVGKFIRQEVTLGPDKSYLVDPEIERNELAHLESVFSTVTPQQLWDSKGFELPIPGGTLTSPFGAFRNFNLAMETRHTGWDLRAPLGQPILASASGTVAYAGFMDIRGNIVIIDHGWGVFSTYCHFAQIHVTRGQTISEGQVLGTVGNTGRTSGPHFHWEIAVNGSFVDAEQFLLMWKPGAGT